MRVPHARQQLDKGKAMSVTGHKSLVLAGSLLATVVLAAPASAALCSTTTPSYADAGKTCSDIEVGALNGTPYISGTPGMQFGPTSVSGSAGGTGNFASASAAAGFGALHVYASSHYDPGNDFNTAHGIAYANFSDELTAGTSGATLLFTAALEGGVSLSAMAFSNLHLYDTSNGDDLLPISLFLNYNSPTQVMTRTVDLAAGHSYLLFNAVEAEADTVSPEYSHGARDAVADLSNTSKLNIDLVSGSFSTFSGHNYASTAASATPEPATWAMMILGLGAIGSAARRRKVAVRPRLTTKLQPLSWSVEHRQVFRLEK